MQQSTSRRDVTATASLTSIQGGDMMQRSQGPIPPCPGCPGPCFTALSPKTTLQGKRSGNTWSLKLAFCPGRLLKFISLHKVYKYLLRAYYTTMLSTCLAQSKPEIDSCSQTDLTESFQDACLSPKPTLFSSAEMGSRKRK